MKYPDYFDEILLQKRKELIDMGNNPYPYDYQRTHSIEIVIKNEGQLTEVKESVSLVGRVTAMRLMGKSLFFDILDDTARIQVYAGKNDFSDEDWKILSKLMDIGDYLNITGFVFRTKMGELTIHASKASIICKPVVRIPFGKSTDEKEYNEIADSEIKYRERYIYWQTNQEARKKIELRFRIISLIRHWMEKEGFLEVLTPTIEMVYGGAEARPFKTNIWALQNQQAYMRISPELYLKRYIAAGFPKVFTICQNFRNEGIDKSHNPEFTMMEWYEAGTDYEIQMERFEQLTAFLANELYGTTKIHYQGKEIDLSAPWRRLSMVDAIKEYAGVDVMGMTSNDIENFMVENDIEFTEGMPKGILIAHLFEELCEDKLIQPTFIIDHPVETSPLTKSKRGMPGFVERFEPFINCMEVGNAYSELTDPVEQFERLAAQREMKSEDDFQNHPLDMDFIKAVGVGLPPNGGVGYGVDRIIMLLTNSATIRDIIPFPMMKPVNY
jgi:lysyl-tRNA synthetase, class II